MSNFTKGKWEADSIYGDHHAVFANDHMVADCFGNEANALLIAAAPEMYELLKVWTEVQAQPTLRKAHERAKALLDSIDGNRGVSE